MYFKFKINKMGLKFVEQTNKIEDGKGIICLSETDLASIDPGSISNLKTMTKNNNVNIGGGGRTIA